VVLGDDVLIGDKRLAESYIDLISRLGVDISLAKTHISPHFCEFAKRFIYRGEEISPFPVSALKNASKRYFTLVALLIEQEKRCFPFSKGLSEIVKDYYAVVKSMPRSFRSKIETNAHITEQIMKVIQKTLPANVAFTSIVRKLDLRIPQPLSQFNSMSILTNLAVESFSESNPTTCEKGGDLGLLATNLVMSLTSFDYPPILMENPLLHAYGSIESEYLELIALARKIDTEGGGDWDVSLKSMTIPLSDSIFVESRTVGVNSFASCKLAHKVTESLKVLEQYPGLFCNE
jgi:hypothetical protein